MQPRPKTLIRYKADQSQLWRKQPQIAHNEPAIYDLYEHEDSNKNDKTKS